MSLKFKKYSELRRKKVMYTEEYIKRGKGTLWKSIKPPLHYMDNETNYLGIITKVPRSNKSKTGFTITIQGKDRTIDGVHIDMVEDGIDRFEIYENNIMTNSNSSDIGNNTTNIINENVNNDGNSNNNTEATNNESDIYDGRDNTSISKERNGNSSNISASYSDTSDESSSSDDEKESFKLDHLELAQIDQPIEQENFGEEMDQFNKIYVSKDNSIDQLLQQQGIKDLNWLIDNDNEIDASDIYKFQPRNPL